MLGRMDYSHILLKSRVLSHLKRVQSPVLVHKMIFQSPHSQPGPTVLEPASTGLSPNLNTKVEPPRNTSGFQDSWLTSTSDSQYNPEQPGVDGSPVYWSHWRRPRIKEGLNSPHLRERIKEDLVILEDWSIAHLVNWWSLASERQRTEKDSLERINFFCRPCCGQRKSNPAKKILPPLFPIIPLPWCLFRFWSGLTCHLL